MSDIDALIACRDVYTAEPDFVYGQAEAILVQVPKGKVFAIRGTTLDGFGLIFRDILIDALAYPWKHPELGWCHKGFLRGRGFPKKPRGALGLYEVAKDVLLEEQPTIAAHSKGGPQACYIAALMCLAGSPPRRLITAGCPYVSLGSRVGDILAEYKVPQAHYVCGRDVVTMIPGPYPPWQKPASITHIGTVSRPWPNISDHRIQGYIDAYQRWRLALSIRGLEAHDSEFLEIG